MAGDVSYANVSLLLHGRGADGGIVFTDNSPAPMVPTLIGAPTTSTGRSKYGTSSMLFGGSADALQFAHAPALNLATGDFTIETWAYFVSLAGSPVICQKDQSFGSTFTSYSFRVDPSGILGANVGTGNGASYSTDFSSAAGVVTAGAWIHLAFTRAGTALRLFAGGAVVATATQTGTPIDGNKAMLIGRFPSGGGAADGWMNGNFEDFRITKGVARYTAAFTPPARSLEDGRGEVNGVITDETGAPASRIVRAYRRDNGVKVADTVSDGSTGAYSFFTPTLDEVLLWGLDDATTGTIYNDIVARVIPE